MRTDFLVVQGIENRVSLERFLRNVMNYFSSREYAAAPFYDSPGTDSALFYRKDKFELISFNQIPAPVKNISEYILRGTRGSIRGIVLRVYSLDFPPGAENSGSRQEQAEALMGHINSLDSQSFLLCVGLSI